jgi:hypothetical protein
MAEKVTDGVNGLHFRRGNSHSLAAVMRHAAETPGLWERLRSGIPHVQTIDEHVERLSQHYRVLLAQRRAADPDASPSERVPARA